MSRPATTSDAASGMLVKVEDPLSCSAYARRCPVLTEGFLLQTNASRMSEQAPATGILHRPPRSLCMSSTNGAYVAARFNRLFNEEFACEEGGAYYMGQSTSGPPVSAGHASTDMAVGYHAGDDYYSEYYQEYCSARSSGEPSRDPVMMGGVLVGIMGVSLLVAAYLCFRGEIMTKVQPKVPSASRPAQSPSDHVRPHMLCAARRKAAGSRARGGRASARSSPASRRVPELPPSSSAFLSPPSVFLTAPLARLAGHH
eukprot:1234413-Rhodomonas_salina.2